MIAHIPLFYKVIFLYIDPLICLSGIYLTFFDRQYFIKNGIPSVLTSKTAQATGTSPLAEHLIKSIGSYSICIFALQILLLHQFKDAPNGLNVRLWKILMFSIALIDVGLLYGVYEASPDAFWEIGSWSSGDWGNNGILGSLVVLRTAFILGIGGVGRET
ncbi:hypothetical protein BDZ45DRAFT_143571 [Acephala macrosclerotiorum]|nr:hypothetical protein BDZ45DRAFT_143571 [Acephala macrosclerotiorum]